MKVTCEHIKVIAGHIKVILGRIKASAVRMKVIARHFFPIHRSLKSIEDRFYLIPDRMKATAGRIKVTRDRISATCEPESTGSSMKEYGRAVGGLELCKDILASLPTLLSPGGVLLLMASSLSDDEVRAAIPAGFSAIVALPQDGRRVPLDVDVVWQNAEWRAQLAADGRIEEDANGVLWHRLRPLWIRRTEKANDDRQ